MHDIADEIKALFAEGELLPLPDVITYQYDYRPGRVMLLRHIQRKYLRRDVGSGDNPSAHEEPSPVAESVAADQVVTSDRDHTPTPSSETATEATIDTNAETKVDATNPKCESLSSRDAATTPVGASDERKRPPRP